MRVLAKLGVVRISGESGRVVLFSPTGVPLDVALVRYEEQRLLAEAKRLRWKEIKAEEDARKAQKRLADIEARSKTRPVVGADGKTRYVPK